MAVSEDPLSANLSRSLEGKSFPVRKDEVDRTLRQLQAPFEVVSHVESISEPDGTFKSYEHLQAASDEVRAFDPSPKESMQKRHQDVIKPKNESGRPDIRPALIFSNLSVHSAVLLSSESDRLYGCFAVRA